jgi:hypothetical protein
MPIKYLVMCLLAARVGVACAISSPCSNVNERLSPGEAERFGRVASAQLKMPGSKVSKVLRQGGWQIILAEPQEADPAYIFYAGAVSPKHFRTFWAGAARLDEEGEILDWTKRSAQGIPIHLAECFAFRVTHHQ